MSLYVRSRAGAQPVNRLVYSLQTEREHAILRGCTPAQFKYAVEIVGSNPFQVRSYLERNAFVTPRSTQVR